MRSTFDPGEMPSRDFYRLLTAVVVPRPIAWVSSTSAEGVDNLAPARLFEEVNATGTDFPAEVSEFDAVGLTREPSATVRPPRVRESPVALEYRLHRSLPVGDCTLVLGEVAYAAVSSEVLEGAHPRIDLLEPLSRLGRDEWGTMGPLREIRRIRAADRPGHFRREDEQDL